MKLTLVQNPGTVLLKASSLWATYGILLCDVVIKIVEYIRDNREKRWQDLVLPVALLFIPLFRVVQQESVQAAENGTVTDDTTGKRTTLRE